MDSTIFTAQSSPNGVGSTILGIVRAPFDFAATIVQTPFTFVQGVTTKVVVVIGLIVVTIFIISRPQTLKGLKEFV